jgi:hypothetical protein
VGRVLIDRRIATDEGVNIRDGNEHGHVACRGPAGDGELIEVPRVVVIDRAPDQVATVAAAIGSGRPGQRSDLRLRRAGKVGFEPTIAHRLSRDLLQKSTG